MSIVCVNCGQCGHVYKHCIHPITSYGIVCYRLRPRMDPVFLVVQRRDSFAYVDFIRGKYDIRNRMYMIKLFRNMTVRERENVSTQGFDSLWKEFWSENSKVFSRPDYPTAKEQFERLAKGYKLKLKSGAVVDVDLSSLLRSTGTARSEPEWGFPKGRRSTPTETDSQCALRELEEETGVRKSDMMHISRKPFEEQYTGNNGVRYKHVYYVAEMNPRSETKIQVCNREIRNGMWATYDHVLVLMKENRERCELCRRINKQIVSNANANA